ncbi:hypothetical protein [Thiomicrorhabdus arctica]|jgi:hypothetical protein|uniref:hypothetical protein n=1 Tax=Thiomicrorhabdus arctica TaxID=131540 RepID=UPI00037A1079|nr:hypothetical protein [Thiomicrorhabdus arctica]
MSNKHKLMTERKTCKTCNMPAYLFWKLQSQLIKLAHQLRRKKLKAAQPENLNH